MNDKKKILLLSLTFSCWLFSFIPCCYSDKYPSTIQQGEPFRDWDQLTSSNKVFNLKFFSLGNSRSRYLGIFYANNSYVLSHVIYYSFPEEKAVWVANRNNPIPDASGFLMIGLDAKLSISYTGGTIVDLTDSTTMVTGNVSATLLDSGNLILQEMYRNGSIKQVLWQSFDYPTDTLLPGMKLGSNFKTGRNWSLTSWASDVLPASGSVSLVADFSGTNQLVIMMRGNIYWSSGPLQNGRFANTIGLFALDADVTFLYFSNETEKYFTYTEHGIFSALTIYPYGALLGSNNRSTSWWLLVRCTGRAAYEEQPGCVEHEFQKTECRNPYDNFVTMQGYYSDVDVYDYDDSYKLTLYDCVNICWNNCSCSGFTFITENRTGCRVYGQNGIFREDTVYDFSKTHYVFQSYQDYSHSGKKKWWIWLITGVGSFSILVLVSCYLVQRKFRAGGKARKTKEMLLQELSENGDTAPFSKNSNRKKEKKRNHELHFFGFQSISIATNNFSSTNKLGEGGFGAVYKGKLPDGQEVAVKRLSRSSGQGAKEFKNEIILIAKLQHTNLVRLLGCCIEKEEKILVYEYMPNNSLDFFLFDDKTDHIRKKLLKWKDRFAIICGVAQGLLYLHKYSRLRVIHRDLKASNILLDDSFNPKISDFGLAKLFGINESEANTSRVVGTRGYMSPEYMIEGTVSMKTDVFSFGVLLIEIVSSKMNNNSYDMEHPLNLIGLAWELWKEGRGLELMDPSLEDSYDHKEVIRCIQVGLLCVQDHATDRPSMADVASMLTMENMQLPEPKRPAFFIDRRESAAKEEKLEIVSVNRLTISAIEAR